MTLDQNKVTVKSPRIINQRGAIFIFVDSKLPWKVENMLFLEVKIVGVFTTDIFIYESLEVWRQSENVGWVYLLNKGRQNTTTNTKYWRAKIFQSGDMWKCSQRRIAPADDKCQNNSDRERKEENTSEQKEQQLFM